MRGLLAPSLAAMAAAVLLLTTWTAGARTITVISYVEVALGGGADAPSLYLFNNHWKSKQGGAAETEVYRRRAAALLATRR